MVADINLVVADINDHTSHARQHRCAPVLCTGRPAEEFQAPAYPTRTTETNPLKLIYPGLISFSALGNGIGLVNDSSYTRSNPPVGVDVQYIQTPQDAELNAAQRMRELGFTDAQVTVVGADGGIDVHSSTAWHK